MCIVDTIYMFILIACDFIVTQTRRSLLRREVRNLLPMSQLMEEWEEQVQQRPQEHLVVRIVDLTDDLKTACDLHIKCQTHVLSL